jgi:formyltetrahydrofolate hydrolase
MKSGVSASLRGRPLVGWHLEDRVIVHQNSTIVFS